MPDKTPTRNRRIRQLFDAAMEQSPGAQADFLWRECGDDEELAQAVWRLLGADRKSDGFLASSPGQSKRAPSFETPGTVIGSYKVIRQLGAGGMGVVYQAVRSDQVFRRVVALKLIRPDLVTELLINVFQQERQILAQLDHPNIARIVDGGSTENGIPYFVMDYVDGKTIDEFSQQHNFAIAQRLGLFRQVCAAVRYLHDQRLVHSDLKPSNILVGSDGIVKILDFGITRVMDKNFKELESSLPIPLMTPAYASPEQLRGEPAGITSDIYSLGVVLYELLTGAKPHALENRSLEQLRSAVTTEDPRPPSAAVRAKAEANKVPAESFHRLRGDLDSITLKAIARKIPDRYVSVADFDTDIARFLECRTVRARRGGVIYTLNRFIKRNQRSLSIACLIAMLLSAVGWQAAELRRNHQIMRTEERELRALEARGIAHLSTLSAPETPRAAGHKAVRQQATFGRVQMQDLRDLESGYRVSFPDAIHISPGWTPERHQLVDQARQYLQTAEPLLGNDSDVGRDLGYAWFLVGNVEGSRNSPSLRDYKAAADSYRQSQRLLEDLLRSKPGDTAARKLLEQVKSSEDSIREEHQS